MFPLFPDLLQLMCQLLIFASIQNSEVGPAGDAASLLFSKSLPTAELNVVESSDAVMKERFVEPDPDGFQRQAS